jgi:hypothetical protein
MCLIISPKMMVVRSKSVVEKESWIERQGRGLAEQTPDKEVASFLKKSRNPSVGVPISPQ